MTELSVPLGAQGAGTARSEVYRLASTVARVDRQGVTLLVNNATGRAVRLSAVAEELLPALAQGATLAQLTERLTLAHPKARGVDAKLQSFLQSLAAPGLLDEAVASAAPRAQRGPRRYFVVDADALVSPLSRRLERLPLSLRWLMLGGLLLAAALALGLAVWEGRASSLRGLFAAFDVVGLLVVILLEMPLHELAHGLACRLAGAPVGQAGLFFHGGFVPGPFVETTAAYRVSSRWRRFAIPAAGPLVDFLFVGAAAAVLLQSRVDGAVHHAAAFVFALCGVLLMLNLNPWGPTDGSHMLEALFDDELARQSALSPRRARLSHARTVKAYRAIAVAFAAAAVALLVFWWQVPV